MATLTKQQIIPAGITPTYAAGSSGGDKVLPGPTTFVHFKNTSGGAITVTIDDPNSVSPSGATAFNPDLVLAIPLTTGDKMMGPITDRFAAVADGLAAITYSANPPTGLTVGAFYL